MCTLSWARVEGGYELFFNRDERRTRGAELEPALLERERVRYVAPRDADFGGTWIAVNERGTTLCLLNGYAAEGLEPEPEVQLESRGRLVIELADAADTRAVAARLCAREAARFRPFLLVALDPRHEALVAEWDGRSLQLDERAEARMPMISSSFAERAVRARRAAVFRERARDGRPLAPDALRACHASHDGGPSAYSVCMHREDAETRSLTCVRVAPTRVELEHTPGPPCRTGARPPLALERTA